MQETNDLVGYPTTQNFTFIRRARVRPGRIRKGGVACAISLLILALGCASNTLVNKSPTPVLPNLGNYTPIQATVYVTTLAQNQPGEEDLASGNVAIDVASALEKNRVFARVTTESDQANRAAFVLKVKSETETNHHFSEEIAEAVISGLTLGLASFAQDTQFEYTVKVQATLVATDGRTVGEYVGEGRFHSTTPDVSFEKIKKVEETVLLSWGHALNELSVRLMQDRENIAGGTM